MQNTDRIRMNSAKECITKIRAELQDYILQHHLQSLIVGISGGIDSALVAALSASVCKAQNIPLIGRFIHIESNKEDEKLRGELVGKAYCNDFKSIDLTALYHITVQDIEEGYQANKELLSERIRLGNIKARLRMIYLYNLAQKHQGIVLATDNLTEVELGYWTLHGDVGDYGLVANLWKTEVYTLSQYLVENEGLNNAQKTALQDCIQSTPTDGLGTTSSDLEQLKVDTYQEVDTLLQAYFAGEQSPEMEKHPIIQRHLKSAYKRSNPYYIPRKNILN
ncbi:MAG: NAD(+) synthase [Bacteroidales bacterium]